VPAVQPVLEKSENFIPKKITKQRQARLRALIEDSTVDCYSEDEAHYGLVLMAAENIACPFGAKVIGEMVEVARLAEPDRNA
jgi:hypothetical protein